MRYIFNYQITLAIATPEGDLSRTRFGCGQAIDVVSSTVNTSTGVQTLNLELADGYVLINVPVQAIRLAHYIGRVPTRS